MPVDLKELLLPKELLSFIIGAVIVSFSIPAVFQSNIDNQQELEIKADIIQTMSESLMNPLGLVQLYEQVQRGDYPVPLNGLENNITLEHMELLQSIRNIESHLKVYFPNNPSNVVGKWNDISAAVYNFILFTLESNESKRGPLVGQVYRLISVTPEQNSIETLKNRTNSALYRTAYFELQENMKSSFDNLTRDIRENDIKEYKNFDFEYQTLTDLNKTRLYYR